MTGTIATILLQLSSGKVREGSLDVIYKNDDDNDDDDTDQNDEG